jgi:hypothetical protein
VQEVVDDEPLVVPLRELARPPEHGLVVAAVGLVDGQPVDDRVVEAQERHVELRDDEVLVVAAVGDPGCTGGVAREVVREVPGGRDRHARDRVLAGVGHLRDVADDEPDAVVEVGRLRRVGRVEGRPVAVERVEVERRLAQVAQVVGDERRVLRDQRVGGDVRDRRVAVRVGRHVVVDELAPVRVDRRDHRVVALGQGVRAGRRLLDHRGAERLQRGDDGRGVGRRQVVRRPLGGEVREEVVEARGAVVDVRATGLLRRDVPSVGDALQDVRVRRTPGFDGHPCALPGQGASVRRGCCS